MLQMKSIDGSAKLQTSMIKSKLLNVRTEVEKALHLSAFNEPIGSLDVSKVNNIKNILMVVQISAPPTNPDLVY